MVAPVHESAFRDLRKLADWFSSSTDRSAQHGRVLDRLARRLGATAVPLLGRELQSGDPRRREAARDALEAIAADSAAGRVRVTAELHAITAGASADEAKVVALGLLSELGEHADVRFADPTAIRVRSAIALAAQLETAADLASAADMMIHQLDPDDIVQMLEVMVDAAPRAAHRLASELLVRLDLPIAARDRIVLLLATLDAIDSESGAVQAPLRIPRASRAQAAVLVDAAARLVVIASRRIVGARRWRRWAVLISATGRIEDCLHEDDAGNDGDAAALIRALCGDGYRLVSTDDDHAQQVVAGAARRTAEATHTLPSAYYLGRDLLELGDAHRSRRGQADPASAALARALELIATGDPARALPLVERCDPANPDAAAAHAAILLAQHQPLAAQRALERAITAEPDWPLHHWNLAAALHELGDARGVYHALRRFIATSTLPSGLAGDPAQPARVAAAERMIAEHERAARLAGRPLRRRTRARVPSAKRGE